MSMQGRSFTSESYRFGYQGSEKDNEAFAGAYTTEFRMLDVRLGRWFTPDPITQPWQSPYVAMNDNPIATVDPLGLEGEDPCGGGAPAATSTMDFGTSIDVPGAGSGAGASPGSGGDGGGGSGGSPASAFNFGGGIGFDVTSFAGQAARAAMPTYRPAATAAGNPISVSNTAANNPSKLGKATQNVNLDNKYEPVNWETVWRMSQPGWSVRIPNPKKPVVGPQIPCVLDKANFISQFSSQMDPKGDGDKCFPTAAFIVKKAGGQVSDGKHGYYMGDNYGNELPDAEKAIERIGEILAEGKPVVLGVNHSPKPHNNDNVTDHFIVIVGKGVDKDGEYYIFWDVGTLDTPDGNDKGTGTGSHKENRLYRTGNVLKGNVMVNGKIRTYTSSWLRVNKK